MEESLPGQREGGEMGIGLSCSFQGVCGRNAHTCTNAHTRALRKAGRGIIALCVTAKECMVHRLCASSGGVSTPTEVSKISS